MCTVDGRSFRVKKLPENKQEAVPKLGTASSYPLMSSARWA